MTRQPTLATRAEAVPMQALGRSQQDQRSTEQFEAALWRETDRSLREDPSRWPWTSTVRGQQPEGRRV
jgi:hypothetical protein